MYDLEIWVLRSLGKKDSEIVRKQRGQKMSKRDGLRLAHNSMDHEIGPECLGNA